MSDKPAFNLEKWRMPIAIVLSLLMVVGYVVWTNHEAAKNPPQAAPAAPPPVASGTNSTVVTMAPAKPGAVLAPVERKAPALATLENEFLTATFTTRGGVLLSNLLKDTHKGFPVDFEENHRVGYQTGTLSLGGDLTKVQEEGDYALLSSNATRLVYGAPGTLDGNPVQWIKQYDLVSNDIRLTLRLENRSTASVKTTALLLNGSSIGPHLAADQKTTFDIDTLAHITGDKYNDALSTTFGHKDAARVEAPEWIAIHNHYYFRALRPVKAGPAAVFANVHGPTTNHLIGAYEVALDVPAGKAQESVFIYSFLPKNRGLLNDLSDQSGIQWFQIFDQWTITRVLSSIMYWPMVKMNEFFKNYGITILVLTLILKIVTWPLNQKSLVTMQKMQSLKPKVDEIQKTYKSNPQKMNEVMMALYKKEKVNPLSGCLPMLIPLPVFIALYSLFRNMIELNHETFLWIQDLSLPDAIWKMPFEIPFIGHYLNLLPIIMTLTQILQSVRTPQPADANKTQQFIFKWVMPIMFLFMLWSMPSALVLFWTAQNIFSWIQAEVVRFQQNRKAAVAVR